MHALQSLYLCLTSCCPHIHHKRIVSLCAASMSAVSGRKLSVSDLGRGLMGRVSIKHNIKRVDRLLSNTSLHDEIPSIYAALMRNVLAELVNPLIIVDWSDLTHDGRWQLLRASLALEGRAVTLYEQVHPLERQYSPDVHASFLSRLAAMLPAGCVPVILTDAGFRSSWFHLVERFGWMWIGRIRNRDMVRPCHAQQWQGCKTLYAQASASAQSLGAYYYVRSNPVPCQLVLVKRVGKGRHQHRRDGQHARSRHSLKHRRSQTEPWLLAVCPRLAGLAAEAVVSLYAQRMQIEEAFRDLKSERFGLGLAASRSKKPERIAVLLLIAAIAAYMMRLIGQYAKGQELERQCQSNTRRSRPTMSVISLALQLVRRTLSTLTDGEFNTVFQRVRSGAMALL